MDALLAAFGIDWRLLIINMVNFGLLLAALWYFLYGPLMKMLDARRAKVAQAMQDAEAAARAKEEIEGSRAQLLSQAGLEADDVLKKARIAAGQKEREIIAASEAVAARRLEEAALQAKELQAQAMEESKKEVAKLIVLGIEKAQVGAHN